MIRIVKIKLPADNLERAVLDETVKQYTASYNIVARAGWENRCYNGVELHHATYKTIRAQYPLLPSQFVCSSREVARESIKAGMDKLKKGKKATCPTSSRQSIRYDKRTFSFSTDKCLISISSVAGRLRFRVNVPAYSLGILAQMTDTRSATLVKHNNGGYWLHIAVEIPDVPFEFSGHVVGVDVGISKAAVTSDNIFFDGSHIKEHSRKLFRLRRALQAKGTKSAYRHLNKLRKREQRFRLDINHQISKRLVASVQTGSIIAMENLTDIRDRVKQRRKQRRELHNWNFYQLQEFIRYKAEDKGIEVQFVDARYSSQACSRCGHISKSNRQSQANFKCKKCDFQLNADLNASRNLAGRAICPTGGLPSQPAYRLELRDKLTSLDGSS